MLKDVVKDVDTHVLDAEDVDIHIPGKIAFA